MKSSEIKTTLQHILIDLELTRNATDWVSKDLIWNKISLTMEAIEDLIDGIGEQDSEDAVVPSCWISFAERKPRAGQWVFVIAEKNFMAVATRQKGTDIMWKAKGVAINNPQYWMPRPR